MALTRKQQRFVAEYLIDLNATQAAIRAGYAARWAEKNATRLTGNDGIREAITAGQAKQLTASDLSAARVLEELRRLALVDARSFWDEQGNLKPFSQLTAEQGSALAGFEAIIKNAKAGDGQTDMIHKIKLWDKPRALEMLAKHFGLLIDKVEHSGGLEITWKDVE